MEFNKGFRIAMIVLLASVSSSLISLGLPSIFPFLASWIGIIIGILGFLGLVFIFGVTKV